MRKSECRLAVIGIRGFPGVQGGVESHCEQLMPRLAAEMPVRVYRRKPFLGPHSDITFRGIDFKDFPSTRIKGFEALWHTFLCCMHLMAHPVTTVNIHNIGPGLFAPLLRLAGMKVVLTYHSPNYEHAKWGRISRWLLRVSERVALSCSNRIIFVSEVQRDKYSDKIRRKSVALPNGINPHTDNPDTGFLEKHGIVPREYVLAVGRLTPEKGFDKLIEAIQTTKRVTTLVIAGAADHKPQYLEHLRRLDRANRVIFPGFTTGRDLDQLYSNAQMYALSSNYEGFPMVLLEAMAHRLPIAATDIPAAHIIPLPAENYCRPADAASMAETIDRVADGPHRVHYNLSGYDWDNIAARTADIYRGLAR